MRLDLHQEIIFRAKRSEGEAQRTRASEALDRFMRRVTELLA
jgi:hypothetical protein